MPNLFQELKRRNVFRVAAAYVVAGWLLVEIFQVLIEIYEAPGWILKLFVAALMVGLPVVLAFSWAYEITPEGIRREADVVRDGSITDITARRLDGITIALLLLAIGLLLIDRVWIDGSEESPDPLPAPVASAPATPAPSIDPAPTPVAGDATERSIAVLPFENLSSNEENAFFASGVHEDILTFLTQVKELRVISRTTVSQYAGQKMDLRQVARDLEVSHILEGSVRRAGNRVRVTAQLIDARSDQHLWAENFDRDLADIFEIQSAIARDIVQAIGARLSPEASSRLNAAPTDSLEAYDLYLQARHLLNLAGLGTPDDVEAQSLLEQAVELDPEFALAHALLAEVHGSFYWFADRTPERLKAMKASIDRALALQPDLTEARIALAGYHYRAFYDYKAALEQLLAARADRPNDSSLLYQLGLTLRRVGRWQESVQAFSQARRLDPGSTRHLAEEMGTITDAHFWDEGYALVEIIDAQHADDQGVTARAAIFFLEAEGPVPAVERYLALPQSLENYDTSSRVEYGLMSRDFDAVMKALAFGASVLEQLSEGVPEYYAGMAHRMNGDEAAARASWLAGLEDAERTERTRQNYAWGAMNAAWILGQLGDADGVRAACERAKAVLSLETDKLHGATFHWDCLVARALTGEPEPLIRELQAHWDQPKVPTAARIRFHPEWDPLRDDPRIQALIAD